MQARNPDHQAAWAWTLPEPLADGDNSAYEPEWHDELDGSVTEEPERRWAGELISPFAVGPPAPDAYEAEIVSHDDADRPWEWSQPGPVSVEGELLGRPNGSTRSVAEEGVAQRPKSPIREDKPYVRWYQQALDDLDRAGLAVDGVSGRLTKAAVRRFQRAHPPLEVDGLMGPQTQAALIAAGAPPRRGEQIPGGRLDCGLPSTRIAVIGGGLAGLMAAWSLSGGGALVTVFEASNRLGGRVRTDTSLLRGKVIEAGAELIGENHPTWNRLARTFGLTLTKVTKDYGPLAVKLRLGDHDLTEPEKADVERVLLRVQRVIAGEAAAVDPLQPWTAPDAAALDAKSLAARLGEPDLFGHASSLAERNARRLFEFFTENDQCAPVSRQSYLGFLAAVRAHTMSGDPLAYWTRTETHRCAGGNEQLATCLAKSLSDVRTGTPVTSIEVTPSSVRVHFGPAGAGGQADYDYAVLASPPTVWPRIESVPAFRPGDYTMAHGPSVKFFSTFDNRFWESRGVAPLALWDRLGSVWEGTDKQRRTGGHALTVYSGGGSVLDPATYRDRMEELYPGYRANLKLTAFTDWPNERWVRTGYSVPAPGQVTTVARNLSRPFAERLLFAGEQASPGFFGYMEGALQAGLFAASRIAADSQIRCGRGEQAGTPAVALSELSGSEPDPFGYLDDLLLRQDLARTEGAGIMSVTAEALEVSPPGREEASASDRRQELIDRMNGQTAAREWSQPGPFSVEGELLTWATELAQAPRRVRESFERQTETQAVRIMIDSGARDEEWLTNLVFHARHRELGGKSIRPDEPRLAHEWQAIRDDVIRRRLADDAMNPGAPPESAGERNEGEGPGDVTVVRDDLVRNAVRSALARGERNENKLTDIGYRALPGAGAPIKAGDPRFAELAEQWIRIRDRIVRPLLRLKTSGLDRLVPRTRPFPRLCCLLFGDFVLDVAGLGQHGTVPGDALGELYTRKLGFIDLGHARETADVTLWVLTQLQQNAAAGAAIELFHGSARLLREIPLERQLAFAQQVTYVDSVEHEITTFGIHLPGGDNSSFSPEDLPSNLFGTLVAIAAFRADGGTDAAITQQFEQMLKAAGAQPAAVARQVQNAAANRGWWGPSPNLLEKTQLRKRNVTADPWLIDERGAARIGHGALPAAPSLVSADFEYMSAGRQPIKNSEFERKIAAIRAAVPASALTP
jgi:monoamine oxidase